LSADENRYQKTYPISWDQLHRDSRALAWRLVEMQAWSGIVAITRGGLVPASIIARELEIRLVDTVCISSYDFQQQGEASVLKSPTIDRSGLLLIDDLVDTGQTARVYMPNPPDVPWWTPSSPRSARTPGSCFPGIRNRGLWSRLFQKINHPVQPD